VSVGVLLGRVGPFTVRQRLQERHHILDFRLVQHRLVALLAIERRIDIQIRPILLRQIVELLHLPLHHGIKLLQVRIPADDFIDHASLQGSFDCFFYCFRCPLILG
jgi:hypothetical protein